YVSVAQCPSFPPRYIELPKSAFWFVCIHFDCHLYIHPHDLLSKVRQGPHPVRVGAQAAQRSLSQQQPLANLHTNMLILRARAWKDVTAYAKCPIFFHE